MPRSRRRHHSRSRSRSRSHSHERDREAKRRKLDALESPTNKRSVSGESSNEDSLQLTNRDNKVEVTTPNVSDELDSDYKEATTNESASKNKVAPDESDSTENKNVQTENADDDSLIAMDESEIDEKIVDNSKFENINSEVDGNADDITAECSKIKKTDVKLDDRLKITPQKAMSPKQLQKKMESEKKRQQKQKEREEKERVRLEKLEQKQKEIEQKQKEKEMKEEQKRKEKEEKEMKRKEKEDQKRKEKEEREMKRKEKEQEELKKQQEKQRQEEQKQKAAAAFANFFVTKKPELGDEKKFAEDNISSIFMPFEIKSDMRLPPSRRSAMTDEEKQKLDEFLEIPNGDSSYLKDLKNKRSTGKCAKTWPFEETVNDDVVIVEDECDFGESICEDKSKVKKMRVKLLKFHANRRPAYFGTWRKKSSTIKPRKPFAIDKVLFDYEVDSDDDWEEEEQGESITGSDDEDNENEVENDDYEVDNEFFVPHGHLSDDEVDDEADAKLSPESLKQKLKLLKDEFDLDMQSKTHKIKPRSIGCIWYDKDGKNVDEVIHRHLQPLAMITNGEIIVKKRKSFVPNLKTSNLKSKDLKPELVPAFLKLIHFNTNNKKVIVDSFIEYMDKNGHVVDVSKKGLMRCLKNFAQWRKCPEEGPMFNKFCWYVEGIVQEQFQGDSSLPNK